MLAVCAFPVVAATPELPANPRALPMQFSMQAAASGCDAGSTSGACRPLLFASGMITADTPQRFETFATDNRVANATVVLDSDGGSVLGALAFGRAIRRLGLDTTVGRADRGAAGAPAGIAPASCESMCAFVLLGGVHRAVPPRSRVLVHQIWLGDRRDDAVAASYSAEDLVLVQRDIGSIVRYTADMGGGAELIEIALRIPPWEPMRQLTRAEMQRAHLDASAQTVASDRTAAAATPVALGPGRVGRGGERGWTLIDGRAGTLLVRRHPLTVEGERLGSFDLTLECGDTAGTYALSYSERRSTSRTGGDAAIETVRLWIEQADVPFRLVSSRIGEDGGALETFAVATVPAGLVQAFADNASHSISVQASGVGSPATQIRIGNAGIARYFGQLQASCGSRAPVTRDAHALLEPGR